MLIDLCHYVFLYLKRLWFLKGTVVFQAGDDYSSSLLGGGVLGDSLCTFRYSVLGKFTRQQKPYGSLDLPGGDGRPLVVVGQAGGFGGDALKDVIHEGVHDGHGL